MESQSMIISLLTWYRCGRDRAVCIALAMTGQCREYWLRGGRPGTVLAGIAMVVRLATALAW
eukprot:2955822-Heterocapsa_arctica.AAC.1